MHIGLHHLCTWLLLLLADDMESYWPAATWIVERERRLVEDMLARDMGAGEEYLELTVIGAHFVCRVSAELVGVCEDATQRE